MDAPAPTPPRPPRPAALPRASSRAWLLVLLVAVTELISAAVEAGRVAPFDDWARAAAHVRAEWRDGDLVVAAPRWADPLARAAVTDLLDLERAGHADLAPYTRLWSLSIRGHRAAEAPDESPEFSAQFGVVRVERWALPGASVEYDLVEHVGDAQVVLVEGGGARACRWISTGRPTGGGLGAGPITPGARHVCDPGRPWLWVGATVEEDLDMRPRRCVWQHPQGAEPVRTTYRDVPLGDEIALHAGLWWEHERTRDGGDVDVVVRLDGEEIGRLVHRDGDGWKGLRATIPEARRGGRGTIDVEVSAVAPHLRSLCWAAQTRRAGPTRAEAP